MLSGWALTAFIPWLEVLPGYQGRGIGGELMRRILEGTDRFYSVDLVCDPTLSHCCAALWHGRRVQRAAAPSDRAGRPLARRTLTGG